MLKVKHAEITAEESDRQIRDTEEAMPADVDQRDEQVVRVNDKCASEPLQVILTYQQLDESSNEVSSTVGSGISRIEGMEGHARACDWPLRKYVPDQECDFEVYDQKHY